MEDNAAVVFKIVLMGKFHHSLRLLMNRRILSKSSREREGGRVVTAYLATANAQGKSMRARFFAGFTIAMGCSLCACGVTSPIERADASSSHFAGAVYKGTATKIKDPAPGSDSYRVFVQGATGFVSMSAVRGDAEQRATDFCASKGKRMDAVAERVADPPYILGNFPRIEIVFQCVDA